MDGQPKPMMNTPIETGITAGEEFEQSKMARLDRLRAEMNITSLALPDEERERLEKFKQESFAHFEQLTGLTFDRETGRCTTAGQIRMEGELKGRWTALCDQLSAEKDPDKTPQLFQEAGRLLREAAGTSEVKPTPADRTDESAAC
jgi:hypothetical protein